jgi:hypothetical protein
MAIALEFFAQASMALDASQLPARERLKSCDPAVAVAAADEIVQSPTSLKEPLDLFPAASVYYQRGKKDNAVFWFYAAQLRTRYQLVFEKGDRGQLLAIMLMTIGQPINNYALQDTARLSRTLDQVLEWDSTTQNPYRNKASSDATNRQVEQVYAGFRDLKKKLATEGPTLEAQARKSAPAIEHMYSQQGNRRCIEGQVDPAFAESETKKEWSQVIEMAKHHPEVTRAAGQPREAFPESHITNHGEVMPSRYIVAIAGGAYAVFDVLRLSGKPKFTLACVTHLSMGRRDPFKDICRQ